MLQKHLQRIRLSRRRAKRSRWRAFFSSSSDSCIHCADCTVYCADRKVDLVYYPVNTPSRETLHVAVANVDCHEHSRPEILYGRPALAALRMQRDALHRLYHAYNGDVNTQSGAKGFRRATFVQVRSTTRPKTPRIITVTERKCNNSRKIAHAP